MSTAIYLLYWAHWREKEHKVIGHYHLYLVDDGGDGNYEFVIQAQYIQLTNTLEVTQGLLRPKTPSAKLELVTRGWSTYYVIGSK